MDCSLNNKQSYYLTLQLYHILQEHPLVLLTYGAYKYYDNSAQYKGSTALVTNKDQSSVPKDVLAKYDIIAELDNMTVYYSKNNPIDLNKLTIKEDR